MFKKKLSKEWPQKINCKVNVFFSVYLNYWIKNGTQKIHKFVHHLINCFELQVFFF